MKEQIFNFIFEYRFIIVVIIAVLAYALFEREKFKSKAFSMMLQAKRLAKKAVLDSGRDQEDWVVDNLYKLLPKVITLAFSEEALKSILRKIVSALYKAAKDKLDDGVINNSIENTEELED
ncbi:hypothetical protein [Clostridium sp. DL1XJH146]